MDTIITQTANCAGVGRGTELSTFTIVNGQWLAKCGTCDGMVRIGIDGRADKHGDIRHTGWAWLK